MKLIDRLLGRKPDESRVLHDAPEIAEMTRHSEAVLAKVDRIIRVAKVDAQIGSKQ